MSLTATIGKELRNQSITQPLPAFQPPRIEPGVRYVQPQNLIRSPRSQIDEFSLTAQIEDRPVLQLTYFPLAIDPADYANPQSNTNPSGSYLSLYAFHQLVDPVPGFTRYYSPTNASTERVYGNVINGAAVVPGSEYTRQIISSAQTMYSHSKLSNLSGIIGTWHPDYATPEDWWDTDQIHRFRTIELDLENLSASGSPYTLLDGETEDDGLAWKIGHGSDTSVEVRAIGRDTRLKTLTFKGLEVYIRRTAWFDSQVFQTGGWYLQGQPKGFCSTGTTRNNTGILPLVPTSFVLGIDVEITADWSTDDKQILDMAVKGDRFVSLGPFALSSGRFKGSTLRRSSTGAPLTPPGSLPSIARPERVLSSLPSFTAAFTSKNTVTAPVWQIIGWISSLVPQSPQSEDQNATLNVPQPLSPAHGTVFSHYPRVTALHWQPVTNATSYTVEVDCYHCCAMNKWCSDVGKIWTIIPNIRTTTHTFHFVGAQPGRWRVWAVDGTGREGPKSNWQEFRYTQ